MANEIRRVMKFTPAGLVFRVLNDDKESRFPTGVRQVAFRVWFDSDGIPCGSIRGFTCNRVFKLWPDALCEAIIAFCEDEITDRNFELVWTYLESIIGHDIPN